MELDDSQIATSGNAVDVDERQSRHGAHTVLSWYDFLCPFCYVGQARTAILMRHGLRVVELPYQAHPDIPAGGLEVGRRHGAMYVALAREAHEAGLPLHW